MSIYQLSLIMEKLDLDCEIDKFAKEWQRGFEFFTVCTNGIIGINGFNNSKKVTSSGARPDARDFYWLKSPMPNLAKLAFACNSETFRSLYSHALLILTKSKSKTQVVHEQKFKDPLTTVIFK